MSNSESNHCDFNKVSLHTNIVDRTNLLQMSMVLRKLVKECDVISIDTEFTGLGDNIYTQSKPTGEEPRKVRPGTEANLDERYESYSRVVKEHALVSLGLTLFKKIPGPAKAGGEKREADSETTPKKLHKSSGISKPGNKEPKADLKISPTLEAARYRASNFEFILFCQSSYLVSPTSQAFLVQNGFDLNRQTQSGIPYLPGSKGMGINLINNTVSTQLQTDLQKYNIALREVVINILLSKAALVVHNGLLDLMFLYHSFYADLPSRLSTFIADVSDWAENGGLFDTKCLSEFVTRDGASYLSFLFNKSLREQAVLHHLLKDKTPIPMRSFSVVMQPRIQLGLITVSPETPAEPKPAPSNAINKLMNLLTTSDAEETSTSLEALFCFNYMFHGNCKDNQYSSKLVASATSCPKSHDLICFLDASLLLARKRLANAKHPVKIQLSPPPFILDFLKTIRPEFYKTVLDVAAKHLPPSFAEPQTNNTHSAQYDSFMTGYVFLHFLNHPDSRIDVTMLPMPQAASSGSGTMAALLTLTKPVVNYQKSYRNHLYLMGKDTPLLLSKSAFSKTSEAHRKLWNLEA